MNVKKQQWKTPEGMRDLTPMPNPGQTTLDTGEDIESYISQLPPHMMVFGFTKIIAKALDEFALTGKEVAERLGMSERKYHRTMAEPAPILQSDLLHLIRLQKAFYAGLHNLVQEGRSQEEIAHLFGWTDKKTMLRVFKD